MKRTFFSPLHQIYQHTTLLVCPPTHYKLVDPDPLMGHPNDMSAQWYEVYKQDPINFKLKAYIQWYSFIKTLHTAGIHTATLQPLQSTADQVFTADGSVSLISQTKPLSFISKFSHWDRQHEATEHLSFLQKQYPERSIQHSSYTLEGSGDNLYDSYRDIFWSGYSSSNASIATGRSSKNAHLELQDFTDVTTVSMHVRRPFFHLDTTFCPLSKGHIVVYPDGLSSQSLLNIEKYGLKPYKLNPEHYLIEVTKQEAEQFACNIVNIGNIIIMSKCGNRLPKLLTHLGYKVHVVDVSMFIAAGGGAHCLVNNVTQKRVIGGLWQNYQSVAHSKKYHAH